MSKGKTRKSCPPLTGDGALKGYVISNKALGPVATVLSILDTASAPQKATIIGILHQ